MIQKIGKNELQQRFNKIDSDNIMHMEKLKEIELKGIKILKETPGDSIPKEKMTTLFDLLKTNLHGNTDKKTFSTRDLKKDLTVSPGTKEYKV